MEDSTVSQVFWFLKCVSWIAILGYASRLRLFCKYRLVFVYILSSVALEIVMPLLATRLGTGSMAYSYLYVGRSLTTAGLAVAVLLMIHFSIRPWSLSRDWHLIAVPTAVTAVGFSQLGDKWFGVRLLDVSYAILSYVGVAAVARARHARHIDLGWNLRMVLLALTLPPVFYSLIFVVYTAGLNLSRQQAGLWMNGVAVASWIILAVGLSEDSPPRLTAGSPIRLSAPASQSEDVSERSRMPQCSS